MLHTGQKPRVAANKIPMITNDDGRATDTGVLADLWERIVAAEQPDDVLSVGLYHVQPWLDVPDAGWTLYQAWYGDKAPLDTDAVAEECWATRHHAEREYLRPEEVVPAAMGIDGGPVAVSESHDATNSGAPGDSTHLLAALLDADIPGGALTFCVDPDAVEACHRARSGHRVRLDIGGKRDDLCCEPLAVEGRVERLGRLQYLLTGHGGDNLRVDMGRAAVLKSADVTIVLTEHTGPGSSPLMYEAMGLNPSDFKIVIAKSPEGFRKDYEPFAAGILYSTAPGCSNPILTELGYNHVSRPVHPVDDMSDMADAEWAGPIAVESWRTE
jgi:microcystin degradation protein MlrC